PDARGTLEPWRADGADAAPADPAELGAARWVFANGQPAGAGTDSLPGARALYLPLAAPRGPVGVLGVEPRDAARFADPEQTHFLEAFASQLAVAVERARLAEEAVRSRQAREMDRLRSEFVAVASDELRTPLERLEASLARLADSAGGDSADGISADGGSTDGGSADGGSTDGGSTDGGSANGGLADGGSADRGSTDGGSADDRSAEGRSADGESADGESTEGAAGRRLADRSIDGRSADRGPAEVRRALREAQGEARRMRALTDDLLYLSRLQAGRETVEVRPVAAGELIARVADRFRAGSQARGIELDIEADAELPPVAADRQAIERALGEMLRAATAMSPDGGFVLLSADAADGYVQLSVATSGAEIAPEAQARTFDAFSHLPGAARGDGTGLGLAIAREIVRAHGGEIWVDSGPGPGAVFSFTLPVAAAAEAIGE
ncbi:MAG: ATP-binding protein, partial [Allosphingosinicella sp.]